MVLVALNNVLIVTLEELVQVFDIDFILLDSGSELTQVDVVLAEPMKQTIFPFKHVQEFVCKLFRNESCTHRETATSQKLNHAPELSLGHTGQMVWIYKPDPEIEVDIFGGCKIPQYRHYFEVNFPVHFALTVANIYSDSFQHASLDVLVLLLQLLAVLQKWLNRYALFQVDSVLLVFLLLTLNQALPSQCEFFLLNPILLCQLHDAAELRVQLVNDLAWQ